MDEESYTNVFLEAHSSILESISTSVEEPPLGPFNHKALKWDFVFRHYGQQYEPNMQVCIAMLYSFDLCF